MIVGTIVYWMNSILDIAIYFAEILIIIRCLLSFLPDWNNAFTAFIYTVTEPMLRPCQKILDQFEFTRRLPIDFSPILLFVLLGVCRRVIGMILILVLKIAGLFA